MEPQTLWSYDMVVPGNHEMATVWLGANNAALEQVMAYGGSAPPKSRYTALLPRLSTAIPRWFSVICTPETATKANSDLLPIKGWQLGSDTDIARTPPPQVKAPSTRRCRAQIWWSAWDIWELTASHAGHRSINLIKAVPGAFIDGHSHSGQTET